MHSKRKLLPLALLLLVALGLCSAVPAFGDSLAVKQAEAGRVQKQVEALGVRTEIAAERYNQARVRYNQITDRVIQTQRRINKLQAHQSFLQNHLNTRVEDMYRNGPLDFLAVLLDVRSFDDFQTTFRVLTTLNNQDAATVAGLKQDKAEAQQAKAILVAAQKQAGQQKTAMAANEADVNAQLAARKRLLASIDEQVKVLMAREIAQQSIEQQARTMAVLLRQRSASAGGIILGGPPPASSKAAAAVYWAEKELGKPYVWAAAGPDSFDCSGLMVWAYSHVGINLNHYSGDQYNEGRHVDKSDLQAGDLVFFGSPIHHVGMYVGGDCFIEAPYTGTDVRISQLSGRGDYSGACRPTE